MIRRPRTGIKKYSAPALIRHGLTARPWRPIIDGGDLQPEYDVVIIGGGVHGLAIAYYLAARHGVTNVAVLERGYIGGGNSGRNTAIIRANYLTPEGISFYRRSLNLYERLADELNFNVMFEPRGQLTVGHDESSIRTLRWRAEANRAMNVESSMLDPAQCRELVPPLDISTAAAYPILGGLWHPPAGIIRHDAVVWAYARGANARGTHIRQGVEVTGIKPVAGDRFQVATTQGQVRARQVVNCTAGWASTIAAMVDLRLPIKSVPLQAAVSEPVKPLFAPILSSSNLHVYVSQTTRGELVFGGAVDAYPTYSTRGSLDFLERLAANMLSLLPALAHVKILRQWSGVCDMTADAAPIIGKTPIEGFYLDVGWGTYGFKAGPAAGEAVADMVATGHVSELIAPFALERFQSARLVNERGAAAVGH